ncbi:chaperone protein dnaJ 20, chloroplastic-like [Salvia hispanica]|uniref:chaperone protein dnaJ 20, chloroplastic-like n=1 Tax=Salvia hispanica TaxID=49212 RepID=UPI00200990B0|nr:chaperone protein dnaJ 20, chloroplastic-like [Salvia hispanica]
MSSKLISSTIPTLQIHSNQRKSPKRISFNSRIQARSPFRGPRACSTAQIHAFSPPAQTKETLYELLGIGEGVSSFSDIKKAYKQMARKYHPDVAPPDRVAEYEKRFIMVHDAYETLSDPRSRELYDRDLAFRAGFSYSPEKYQGMEEKKCWRNRWESQLDELQRRNRRERPSWGEQMRNN